MEATGVRKLTRCVRYRMRKRCVVLIVSAEISRTTEKWFVHDGGPGNDPPPPPQSGTETPPTTMDRAGPGTTLRQ